jgi:hypothetical protein
VTFPRFWRTASTRLFQAGTQIIEQYGICLSVGRKVGERVSTNDLITVMVGRLVGQNDVAQEARAFFGQRVLMNMPVPISNPAVWVTRGMTVTYQWRWRAIRSLSGAERIM